MNQETPNPLFGGFQPQVIEGNALPVEPAAPPAGKKARKSKKTKPAGAAQAEVIAEATPAKKARKPRAAKTEKRAPKFELQAILKATAGLKEADMRGFEKGLDILMDANAAGRARLLAAWAKVFA